MAVSDDSRPRMRVHIVRPLDGWVLQRMAESFELPDRTLGTEPDPTATINFFVNYYLYTEPTGTFDVAFFTHRPGDDDEALRSRFDTVAGKVHACVAMCRRTASFLDPRRTLIVHGAPDPIFRRADLVLGVVARAYPRKRMDWIPALQEISGVTVRVTGGALPFEALPDFYRGIDYLVILSDNEGGPIPVLEALVMGKPVIAPDVGFSWEYPVLRYDGSLDDLRRVVRGLVIPPDAWVRQSRELDAFFHRMLAVGPR